MTEVRTEERPEEGASWPSAREFEDEYVRPAVRIAQDEVRRVGNERDDAAVRADAGFLLLPLARLSFGAVLSRIVFPVIMSCTKTS